MNAPLLNTIKTSLDIIRELNASSVREAAAERADQMLGRYGYSREASFSQQVISHGASFGVGMAVGAGLGLLFAPERGDKTRDKIATSANDILEQVNDAMKEAWPMGSTGEVRDEDDSRATSNASN